MFGRRFSPSFGLPKWSDVISLYQIYRFVDGLNIIDKIDDWATKKIVAENDKKFEPVRDYLSMTDQVEQI